MINETDADIVRGDFHCPRCGGLMEENRPEEDKHLVINKHLTVRLKCPCGHYEDRVMNKLDFLN